MSGAVEQWSSGAVTTFLNRGDREVLEAILRESESEIDRHRAEILLGFEDGKSMREIAEQVDSTVQRVLYWRREYLKLGMGVFE